METPHPDYLPDTFSGAARLKKKALQKIAALEAAADELPVFIIHDARDLSVSYMSSKGLYFLGATLEEVRKMGPEYFTKFFNPVDVAFYLPRFIAHLGSGNTDWFSFFQQVRTGNEKSFEWYLSTAKPLLFDEDDQPILFVTFALPLAPRHPLAEKVDRLMEENLLLREYYERFATLTRRERELLQYIACGENSGETSTKMYISEKTLSTHKRNIKRKLGVKSRYELIRLAQAFNLI